MHISKVQAPTKLDHALRWAARGFHVLPLIANGKTPAFGGGHLAATLDPGTIRAWWMDPLTGSVQDYNIGLSPRDGRHLIIDLDVKESRNGIENYRAMVGEIAGLVVKTAGGGLHIYYSADDAPTGAGKLGAGIDHRGPDGFVVAPGSTIDGVPYEVVEDTGIRPLPAFVAAALGTRAERDRSRQITTFAIENDQERNVQRFAEACRRADPAVAGVWHDASRDLACEAVRCAVSVGKAIEVMLECWVSRGTGFFEDGRHERWRADVEGSYQWAFAQGEHGVHSVDAQRLAFSSVDIVPPPCEPELPTGTTLEAAMVSTAATGPAWTFTVPTALQNRPVPTREFIVDQWLSPGHVTILYGEGGTGKSLLAMQLMTAAAAAREWCGLKVQPCRALGLFCEDDDAELHRRQSNINAALGIEFGALGDMAWASGVGLDNTLITFDREGLATATPAFTRLLSEARRFGARLVVVDTAADTFGGNENERRQVRQFVGAALGRLALELDAAVLLTAHPSRAGRNSGDLDGGSTAWSNTARARWAMSRVDGREGEVDSDLRVLSRRKSNYAAIGDTLRIRYQDGAFVVPTLLTGDQWRQHQFKAQAAFLGLLNRVNLEGREVSASKQSSNYAPSVFSKRPDREGLLRADFEDAMGHLLALGRVEVATGGKASRPSKFLRPLSSGSGSTPP